jgi:hypothetical protein
MKRYILKEQANTKIVNAPSDELYILNQDIFKGKGRLVNLSTGSDGTPIQVTVGGKTYTAGLKTDKGNYIVYDGRVLTYTPDKGYQYLVTPNGKIGMVKGSVDRNLQNSYLNLLSQFGIRNVKNLYSVLGQVKDRMQTLIDKGSVGDVFRDFNQVLAWYYPNDPNKQLIPPSGKTFDPPIDKNVLASSYDQKSLSDIGLTGSYYLPKGAAPVLAGQKIETDVNECREILKNYLIFAVQSQAFRETLLNSSARNDYKKSIRYCYGSGAYNRRSFKPFTEAELDLPVAKEFRKFNLFNKNLTYKDISKILSNIDQRWGLIESTNNLLDNKIKMALNEQLIKQKKLITERKIVENRLRLLSSNYKKYPRLTEQQKTILSFRILKEISFLSEENLLNEQLMDFVRNLFGNLLPSGLETIVERVVNSILSKLGFGDGYIQKFFVSLIATRPTEFFKALKSCQDLTKLISRSIVEAMVMKLQENLNKGGGGYDLLRNLLGNSIQEQPFVDAVEKNISSKICEIYNTFTGKAKSVVDTLGG